MYIDAINELWIRLTKNAGCKINEVNNMFDNRGVMSNTTTGLIMIMNDESKLQDLSADKPLLVCMASKKDDNLFPLHKRIADRQKQRGRYFWWETDCVINTNLTSVQKEIKHTES